MFEVLVATLIKKNGKILLVTEKKEGVAGKLNLPAGHLEIGESIASGARREVLEETGLDVELTHLIDVKYFTKVERSYIVFVFKGNIKPAPQRESELQYDYYNIDYIKSHAEALRNPELLFSALQSADGGSSEAIELLK